MLNPNAQRLVDALRSGEVEQFLGSLRGPGDERCCLGVACDLSVTDVVGGWDGAFFDAGVDDRDDALLPDPVRKWLGFCQSDGAYYVNGERHNLSGQNDDGLTFAEIADIIESEPEGLFA